MVGVEVNRIPNGMVLSSLYLQRFCQDDWKVTDVGGPPRKRVSNCVVALALYYGAEQ